MKRALILAAGKGKRLGALTASRPKCLLQLTHSKTILDFLITAIREAGINEVIIISGFREDVLKNHIEKYWASQFIFKIIYNPKHSEYNNIYSAYLAKDLWDDQTILFNSDIIFDPSILKSLVTTATSHKSYLVIDDTKELNEEDMKVIINKNGEIKRVNKSLKISDSFGEYIGITCLQGSARIKFLDSIVKNIKNQDFGLYYEDALDQIADEVSVFPHSTENNLWTEVDTEDDYKKAIEIAKKLEVKYASNKHTSKTTHFAL